MKREHLFIVSWCLTAAFFTAGPFLSKAYVRGNASAVVSGTIVAGDEAKLRALIGQDKISAQEALCYEVLNER